MAHWSSKDHFVDREIGKANPCDVYEAGKNKGCVNGYRARLWIEKRGHTPRTNPSAQLARRLLNVKAPRGGCTKKDTRFARVRDLVCACYDSSTG